MPINNPKVKHKETPCTYIQGSSDKCKLVFEVASESMNKKRVRFTSLLVFSQKRDLRLTNRYSASEFLLGTFCQQVDMYIESEASSHIYIESEASSYEGRPRPRDTSWCTLCFNKNFSPAQLQERILRGISRRHDTCRKEIQQTNSKRPSHREFLPGAMPWRDSVYTCNPFPHHVCLKTVFLLRKKIEGQRQIKL